MSVYSRKNSSSSVNDRVNVNNSNKKLNLIAM